MTNNERIQANNAEMREAIEMAENLPEAGGVSNPTIIDVISLPETDINEDAFYRVLTGSLVFGQFVQNTYTCHCVDGLPETGEPATNADQSAGNVYYNTQDGSVYGYVDDILSAALSVPAGWYPVETLLGALGFSYAGVITDISEDPQDGAFRLLLEYALWQYKDKWVSMKAIGWAGEGASAEVFNHPTNRAIGECSHAEGCTTTASGYISHAEGYNTTASGDHSHAEGYYTTASGLASHAEGYYTTASGQSQHTQGECNLPDPDVDPENPNARGKYAHIVGNGTSFADRSNAHTLDWNGVGWFQGGLQVGGTKQDGEGVGYVPAVQSASVGQTIVVKSVDSNSKPTAWEAADMGIQIKKTVFTDRPSLLQFLRENFEKIDRAILKQSSGNQITCKVHATTSENEFWFDDISYFATGGEHGLSANQVRITGTVVELSLYNFYRLTAEGVDVVQQSEPTTLPDEYWPTMGIEVTIYYFSE